MGTSPFVAKAVAVAMTVLSHCNGSYEAKGDYHPTYREVIQLAEWSERYARLASDWSGYEVSPEFAWIHSYLETGFHSLHRHCRGGDFNREGDHNLRSVGYFCLVAPAYADSCLALDQPCPQRGEFGSRPCRECFTRFTKSVCEWAFDHPEQQVAVLFQQRAEKARAYCGSIPPMLAFYRAGNLTDPEGYEYADQAKDQWRKLFSTYPQSGRLRARRHP